MSQSSTLRTLGGIFQVVLTALKVDLIPQIHKQTAVLIKSREQQFEDSSEKPASDASKNDDMMTQLLVMKSKHSTILPW